MAKSQSVWGIEIGQTALKALRCSLVDGEVVLAETSGTSTVKGQAKFEVYPGQPAADQIHDTIDIALNMAKEKGRDGA